MDTREGFRNPTLANLLFQDDVQIIDVIIFGTDAAELGDVGTVVDAITSDFVDQTFEINGTEIRFRPVRFSVSGGIVSDITEKESVVSINNNIGFDVNNLINAKNRSVSKTLKLTYKRFVLPSRTEIEGIGIDGFISKTRRTVIGTELSVNAVNLSTVAFPVDTINNLNFII